MWEYLKKMPQVTVPLLEKALKMTAPTARSALKHLVSLDILETNEIQRNKIYVYKKYLNILEEGI